MNCITKMGNMVSIRRQRRRRQHLDSEGSNNYPFEAQTQPQPQPPHYPNTLLPPYHRYPQISNTNLVHIELQKTISIRNDVSINKDTLCMEPDQHNPSHSLLAFTFDATAPGCITVMFFAKETLDGELIAVKKSLLKQISMPFQQGFCQKFKQPSGTGIEISVLEETGLTKGGDAEVYPLALKAEARPLNRYENDGSVSQITLATFEKREKGKFKVHVMKQVLRVNGIRYELQEIYGIGNSSNIDGHQSAGDCVICLSEPRDITVLPCRHMCMCSGCASLLKVHTASCPICRQPVERLLEIKLNN